MRFFVDTADVDQIRKANDYGSYLWSYNKPFTDR